MTPAIGVDARVASTTGDSSSMQRRLTADSGIGQTETTGRWDSLLNPARPGTSSCGPTPSLTACGAVRRSTTTPAATGDAQDDNKRGAQLTTTANTLAFASVQQGKVIPSDGEHGEADASDEKAIAAEDGATIVSDVKGRAISPPVFGGDRLNTTAASTLGFSTAAQQAASPFQSYPDQVELAAHRSDDGAVIQPAVVSMAARGASRESNIVDLTGDCAVERDDIHNNSDDHDFSSTSRSYNRRSKRQPEGVLDYSANRGDFYSLQSGGIAAADRLQVLGDRCNSGSGPLESLDWTRQGTSCFSAEQSPPAVPGHESTGPLACNASAVSSTVARVTDGQRSPVLRTGGRTFESFPPLPPVAAAAVSQAPGAEHWTVEQSATGSIEAAGLLDDAGQAETCSSSATDEVFFTMQTTSSSDLMTTSRRSPGASPAICENTLLADDDDVDRKLADELERLKNLVIFPKIQATNQTMTSSVSCRPDEDKCSNYPDPGVNDVSDNDNDEQSFELASGVGRKTADSLPGWAADIQHTSRTQDISLNVSDSDYKCCVNDPDEQEHLFQLASGVGRKTADSMPEWADLQQSSRTETSGSHGTDDFNSLLASDPGVNSLADDVNEHSLQLASGGGRKIAASMPDRTDIKQHRDQTLSDDGKEVSCGRVKRLQMCTVSHLFVIGNPWISELLN